MAKVNVSLPQGTRDFPPDVLRKRQFIIQTIKSVFELYGFEPLETPAMENLDTLMGKYGEEGDKLIFKILNNGLERQEKHEKARADFEKVLEGKNVASLTERALRYDLTIPFARYVAMNHGQLTFPFKRYQIQPVWRADRPQKGRYREFYQCDADVVGSTNLLNEVELALIYSKVFERLKIPVEIRVNSRHLLAALAEQCGGQEVLTDITVAIDKLDKIGIEQVKEALLQKGLSEDKVAFIEKYLTIEGTNQGRLMALKMLLDETEEADKGFDELDYLINRAPVIVDFTLARGLNYYTGIIYEVKAKEVQMGSIGGGGRYDDLTGLFGVPNIPGVGISFGLDRIYDVMEELKLFPGEVQTGTQVLFFNMGDSVNYKAFELMQHLRNNGTRCEMYHEPVKLDKQFKYAEKKSIPYAIIIGEKEIEEGKAVVKNLSQRREELVDMRQLQEYKFG